MRQPGVRGRFRRRQDPSVAVIRRERCTRVRRSQIVRVPGLEPWPLRGGTTTVWHSSLVKRVGLLLGEHLERLIHRKATSAGASGSQNA